MLIIQSSLTDLNLFKSIENLVVNSWNVNENNNNETKKANKQKYPKQTTIESLKKKNSNNTSELSMRGGVTVPKAVKPFTEYLTRLLEI